MVSRPKSAPEYIREAIPKSVIATPATPIDARRIRLCDRNYRMEIVERDLSVGYADVRAQTANGPASRRCATFCTSPAGRTVSLPCAFPPRSARQRCVISYRASGDRGHATPSSTEVPASMRPGGSSLSVIPKSAPRASPAEFLIGARDLRLSLRHRKPRVSPAKLRLRSDTGPDGNTGK